MDLTEIKQKIRDEVGVVRLPAPRLDNVQNAVNMFSELASEMLKKKDLVFDLNPVEAQIILMIKWAYMLGDDLDFTKGILLKGHTGRGKTFLFRVFDYFTKIDSLHYLENGKHIPMNFKIVNVKRIAGEYQSPAIGGFSVIQKYAGYRCLVLDDIGKEQDESLNFGNRMNVVEEIINIREEQGLLTFGTTNLNRMNEKYDDRTVSRMNTLFNVININHETDFRNK